MTATAIILNLAMSLPAVVVLSVTAVLVLRTGPEKPDQEGRADWRGPSRRYLPFASAESQRRAASLATATNSSAR